MCGIFGMVRDPKTRRPAREFAFLCALAEETQVRGRDATGFAAVMRRAGFVTDKAPVPASRFVGMSSAWARLAKDRPTALIGHCRLATAGSPARNDNNHPHHARDLWLVHNGCLMPLAAATYGARYGALTECDSEVIVRIVAAYRRVKDGIASAFRKLRGAADQACAMIDRKRGGFYLWRDRGRPICLAFKGEAVYFASTREILTRAAARVGFRFDDFYTLPPYDVYYCPVPRSV